MAKMKVSIKDWGMPMEIKNKGIEIDVADDSSGHWGDLCVTKTGLVWCKGRIKKENGAKLTWEEFRNLMDDLPRLKKALKKL